MCYVVFVASTTVTIRISMELLERVDKLAASQSRSRNWIIVAAVEANLDARDRAPVKVPCLECHSIGLHQRGCSRG
jgi:hypothetical protein